MILTFNEDSLNTDEIKKKKLIFFENILQDLNESKDNEEKYFCVCDTLNNCFSKKEFFFLFMTNEELVKLLFSLLCGNINNEKIFKILLNLMIRINEKILLLFDKLVTPNLYVETHSDTIFNEEDETQINYEEQFKSILVNVFKESIDYFFLIFSDLNNYYNNQFESTYQQPQQKLGYKKLIQIEYFRTSIDIIVNAYSKKYYQQNIDVFLKKEELSKIFWMLHDIFIKFEFNNIYQTLYLQLMIIIINENSPENLIKSVFINENENQKLIPILIERCLNSNIFKYSSEHKTNSCSLASNIKLLYEINNSNNEYVKKLIENDSDFKVFNEVLVQEIYSYFNGKLLFNELKGFPTQFNKIEDVEMSTKSVEDLFNEDVEIYNTYKKGGDYKVLFEEKLKRQEEKKKNEQNFLATSQLANSIILSGEEKEINDEENDKKNDEEKNGEESDVNASNVSRSDTGKKKGKDKKKKKSVKKKKRTYNEVIKEENEEDEPRKHGRKVKKEK